MCLCSRFYQLTHTLFLSLSVDWSHSYWASTDANSSFYPIKSVDLFSLHWRNLQNDQSIETRCYCLFTLSAVFVVDSIWFNLSSFLLSYVCVCVCPSFRLIHTICPVILIEYQKVQFTLRHCPIFQIAADAVWCVAVRSCFYSRGDISIVNEWITVLYSFDALSQTNK